MLPRHQSQRWLVAPTSDLYQWLDGDQVCPGFTAALNDLAADLGTTPGLLNYRHRRDALRTWTLHPRHLDRDRQPAATGPGTPVSLLPKVADTEFAWGYGGAGPRELARCLLHAALGAAAACPACHGAAKLAVGDDGAAVPCRPGLEDDGDPEAIIVCQLCDDG